MPEYAVISVGTGNSYGHPTEAVSYTHLECVVFCAAMNFIGFWITSMLGMMMFIMTLRADKKINVVFAVVLSIVLGSVCYFGFTKGFNIPLPKGVIWSSLGIKMP